MKREPLPPTRRDIGQKRADRAYEHLKHRLIRGELPAGARIDVNALVAELGASRQPVLAAIARLAGEGFLRVVPQVGCWVADVADQEVADFFCLFASVEGVVCELAAARRTGEGIARLRDTLDRTERLIRAERDPGRLQEGFFHLNRIFHAEIHDIAQSTLVARLAGGMWDRCDFYLANAERHIQGTRAYDSEREHEGLVAAIERGDAAHARKLMVRHIESFGDAALSHMKARQGRRARG